MNDFFIVNFAKHKGYPTLDHRKMLHEKGPCPVHRLSYGPVRSAAAFHAALALVDVEKNKATEAKTTKQR
jgi:ribonuclease HII